MSPLSSAFEGVGPPSPCHESSNPRSGQARLGPITPWLPSIHWFQKAIPQSNNVPFSHYPPVASSRRSRDHRRARALDVALISQLTGSTNYWRSKLQALNWRRWFDCVYGGNRDKSQGNTGTTACQRPQPITRVQCPHYSDVIMGTIASQIISLMIVYSVN